MKHEKTEKGRFFFWLTARGVIGAAIERNFLNSSYFVRKGPDQG